MNNSLVLPLLALSLSLPAAARAGDLPSDAKAAEAAVRAARAASVDNLKALKDAKDKPKPIVARAYGKEKLPSVDPKKAADLRAAVEVKKDYWNAVLDVMNKEREKIDAEIDKVKKGSQEHVALVKVLGNLMDDFKVARAIADDIRLDGKLVGVWEEEAKGNQVVGGESVSAMFQRKTALFASLKGNKSGKKSGKD